MGDGQPFLCIQPSPLASYSKSAFVSIWAKYSPAHKTVFAKASLVGDTVIAYSQATWAQQVMSFILSGAGAAVGGPYGAVAGIIAAEGITSLAEWYANGHTDQELYDAYNQYVTDLQTDLGTTTLIDGGVRIIHQPYVGDDWYFGNVNVHDIVNNNGIVTYKVSASSPNYYMYVYYPAGITCPFDAYVSTGIYSSYNHPTSAYATNYGGNKTGFFENQIFTAGSNMRIHSKAYDTKNRLEVRFEEANKVYIVTVYAYYDLIPIGGLDSTKIFFNWRWFK